jgi:hypothetical protein
VPWEFQREWHCVDLLYSGIVANGSTLPLVLITTDSAVPANIEGDTDAIVLYMPGIKKPSAATTLAVLDCWKGYLTKGDHLLLDRGVEFKNAKVLEELKSMGVTPHFYPTGGGAHGNPNDNSLFSQVEG